MHQVSELWLGDSIWLSLACVHLRGISTTALAKWTTSELEYAIPIQYLFPSYKSQGMFVSG